MADGPDSCDHVVFSGNLKIPPLEPSNNNSSLAQIDLSILAFKVQFCALLDIEASKKRKKRDECKIEKLIFFLIPKKS
jgi:hypothetical protein